MPAAARPVKHFSCEIFVSPTTEKPATASNFPERSRNLRVRTRSNSPIKPYSNSCNVKPCSQKLGGRSGSAIEFKTRNRGDHPGNPYLGGWANRHLGCRQLAPATVSTLRNIAPRRLGNNAVKTATRCLKWAGKASHNRETAAQEQ